MMLDKETMLKTLMGWKEIGLKDKAQGMAFLLKMIKEDHIVCQAEGFAFYAKITDATLDKIEQDPKYFIQHAGEIIQEKGDNLHFFGLVSVHTGNTLKGTLKGLKEIIDREKPKTISWYNKTMTRFIRRSLICHQQ